jgi:uroporphyrinogen-III synthase
MAMAFGDARIALLEARMSKEMADLMRRAGNHNLILVPAVREKPLHGGQQVNNFIDRLVDGTIQTVVFFTGVGARQLLYEAEQLGRQADLLAALRAATIVCRGPKPAAVLKRYNIPIAASAQEPYTTRELLEALEPRPLVGTTVGVVHYGEYNALVAQRLHALGADLVELCLYEWLLPEDTSALRGLVADLIAQRIDAVVFTSQVQVRHLFLVARETGQADWLTEALNTKTVVASIGPTCTGALQDYGVTPHVMPEHPKMGYLVKALADYLCTD